MNGDTKTAPKRLVHQISALSDDEGPLAKKAKVTAAAAPAAADHSDDESPEAGGSGAAAAATPDCTVKRSRKKSKCKYWDKCFRKNQQHLKQYLHPGDKVESGSDDESEEEESDRLRKRTVEGTAVTALPKIPTRLPDLMLAHKWEDGVEPKGWLMSEKLDGVRAYWNGKCFYSRLKNKFPAPAWFTKDLPTDVTLDGELFGGRGKFQSTVSIVKSGDQDARWSGITYQIFDTPSLGSMGFEKRMDVVKKYFDENPAKYAKVLDQQVCKGQDHLDAELKRVQGLGGEGLMMRKPKSQYENCRSKMLLKVKTFYDAEAKVIGHEASKSNPGLCGALMCVMECGVQFKVGSGMSNKDRRNPPKKGSIITYKFQEYTNSGKPRFPSYIGVRIDANKPKDAVIPGPSKTK